MYLDRRSGAPLLRLRPGHPVGRRPRSHRRIDRGIVASRSSKATGRFSSPTRPSSVLDREASGLLSPDVWQIAFGRADRGVPVDGAAVRLHGGPRQPDLLRRTAVEPHRRQPVPRPRCCRGPRHRLDVHGTESRTDGVRLVDKGSLRLIPPRAERRTAGRPRASVGSGSRRVVLTGRR